MSWRTLTGARRIPTCSPCSWTPWTGPPALRWICQQRVNCCQTSIVKITHFFRGFYYLNSDAVGRLSRSLAKPSAGLVSPPAACSGPPLLAGGRFPAAPAPGPPGDLDRPAFFSPAADRGVFGRAPPSCDDPVNPPDAPVRPPGPSVLASPLRALPPAPPLSDVVSDGVGRASATSIAAVFTLSAAPGRPVGFPDATPPGEAETLLENIPPPPLCVMLG